MRLFDLLGTANRNLSQARVRSILTILAIVVGAFTLTLTLAFGEGLKQYVDGQAAIMRAPRVLLASKASGGVNISGIGAKPAEYDPTTANGGIKLLESDDLDSIRQMQYVEKVLPGLPVGAEYLDYGNKKYKTLLTDLQPEMQFSTVAGSLKDVSSINNGVALGYGYIEVLGFKTPDEALNKEITLVFKDQLKKVQSYKFVVKAVFANSLLLNSQAMINYPRLQTISEWQASGIPEIEYSYVTASVILQPNLTEQQIESVQNNIQAKGINAGTYEASVQSLTSWVGQAQFALGLFSAIAILAAAFGIVNTLYMAVTERTREVGLLKALGMRDGRIFSLFALEAALIGLWGSLIGVLLAILLSFVLNPAIASSLESFLPGFQALSFPPTLLIGVLAAIALLALLAGTFPALKAMRQDPITALRYE